ncbi:SdiA-regulated family protein [Pedobacter sp.]|uniref:SdiA-regulated family protein n=1 Tax=Pedobacter sp. TaxID=1411316 RepID=UPI003D7F3F76
MHYKSQILLPVILLMLALACKPAIDKYTSPPGYNLKKPEKFNMPESLLEISGIAFHQGKSDTVYSVQDENGRIFKQIWGQKKQTSLKFAKKGDYEDLTILKDSVFVLKSSGSLIAFPLSAMELKETEQVKEWGKILPKGEYESLYADQEKQLLYVICKDCKVDNKTKNATGYVLQYKGGSEDMEIASTFIIYGQEVEAYGPDIKSGLKTSALAQNPRTKEWYILSSVHKLLVIAAADWKIKAVHALPPSTFNQPEGIAFDKEGNLFISNEGDEISSGNILKFTYQP